MYLQFFGFLNPPFSDTPDVRLFWEEHYSQLIYKSLLQGLNEHSALQYVIAEPGLGKSVLCRRLHNSLRTHRSRYDVLFMAFPNLDITEWLNAGRIQPERGRRKVLIIDEAQAMSRQSLAELTKVVKKQALREPALLTVLFAQPEFEKRLTETQLDVSESPTIKRFNLLPLTAEETAAYIDNRMELSGVSPGELIHPEMAALVYKLTGGVPRLINTLMRKSLLIAFENQSKVLTPEHLRGAASTTAAAVPHVSC